MSCFAFRSRGALLLTLLLGCGSSGQGQNDTGSGGSSAGRASSGGAGGGAGTSSLGGRGALGGLSAGGATGGDTAAGGTLAGGSAALGGAGAGGSSAGSDTHVAGKGAGGVNGAGGYGAGGAVSASGDIVGKISVGYQGWFTAPGDGSGINPPWWHWTANRNTPTPSNISIKSWPDVSEFTNTYATGFPALGNGGGAELYSNWDASTVDTQIRWMKEAGLDTIALQRFGDFRGTGEARNIVAENVRKAAEAHGRKFYIMYDISGWSSFQSDLKSDWAEHIVGELALTDSPAYAQQDAKPVVAIWGLGYSGHPGTPETTQDVIDYFHQKGLYVIGGVGNDWRSADGTRWSQAGFGAVFDTLDAISPWMVGVIGDAAASDSNRKDYNESDVAYLHARHKHYQPCVLPGDLQEHQRHHGDFMWRQFFNMVQIKSDGIYISMYDEYNEGNQIAKTAATSASVPSGSGFVTLDEDGTACSSDYYLRLAADGGKMLRGEMPLTATRPTPPK